ncbi:MAG: CBS domain-containing protein [Halobacteria archaeon]
MTKVREVMVEDVVTCGPDDAVSEVAKKIRDHEISGMPVVEDGEVVGVVTEADLLSLIQTHEEDKNIWLPSPFEAIELPIRAFPWKEWLEDHHLIEEAVEDIGSQPVSRIMTHDVETISPEVTVQDASHTMVQNNVNRLPVVQEDQLVGLVTRGDILQGVA